MVHSTLLNFWLITIVLHGPSAIAANLENQLYVQNQTVNCNSTEDIAAISLIACALYCNLKSTNCTGCAYKHSTHHCKLCITGSPTNLTDHTINSDYYIFARFDKNELEHYGMLTLFLNCVAVSGLIYYKLLPYTVTVLEFFENSYNGLAR